jgi:1,2-phenylacetyl-CoA epoxidase catalytic subunit
MLVTSEELRFDFKGASFDMSRTADRKLLSWIFSQFLYGEVTGIQCGHWLYRAPHFGAAAFLARQATEELSHVRKFIRILSLMGEKPEAAHWAVKFLSTGMMGNSWGEHVVLEMALGEGLVLGAFYALVDTIGDPEIRRILASAATEEERHVEFGERETQAWLLAHPETRDELLAQALIQSWALRKLKGFISRRLLRGELAEHGVLKQFDAFFVHAIEKFELRAQRLGLSSVPLSELSRGKCLGLVLMLPFRKLLTKIRIRRPLLTTTYLQDPSLQDQERSLPSR